MHLTLSAAHGLYLQQMLARAVPQMRDTPTMAPMKTFLQDVMQRLAKGERDFDLDKKQARYLRRTVRAVRQTMERQAATPAGGMMKSQLVVCKPLFKQILDTDG